MSPAQPDDKEGAHAPHAATIGILQSNSHIRMPPGDVGNARTFAFPVIYRVVDELTGERLIVDADPALAGPIIRGAHALEALGVSAITGDCGHLIQFQQQVKVAVDIPVFLSSWLQIPFIAQILPPNRKIGALIANSRYYRPQFLRDAGIDDSIKMVVAGMENCPAFRSAVIDESGELDAARVEQEIVGVARQLKQENPDLGAVFLECSDMPPYAAAIQDALKLPVFDFVTMINFIYSTLTRSAFEFAE